MKRFILDCDRCQLCETAQTVGLEGRIGTDTKLAIFLDHPGKEDDQRHKFGFTRATKLLWWMLDRMSIAHDNVSIIFTLRCFKGEKQLSNKAPRLASIEACSSYRFATLQKLKPKAILAMGKISCEAFLAGAQIKDKDGCEWNAKEPELKGMKVWVCYATGYALQSPPESVSIYRTLWRACESAGLKPKTNLIIPQFNYDYE